ncbi:hypothetical protein GCM10010520_22510 [Rhizobium viscosum]|uniref:Uncharacterized protein n=1 Tax=Rhizobium viscosum TaxID=1673 RepID=A0ABR9IIL1_RHIVS|nr:hypothetical protein [Rhizobium viscosum]MBE1503025.1 hypothetical protein [Rhizobium viscosum]
MTDILDNLRTPQQIAERSTAATGVHITARTVGEKARRFGIAKKIGRSMLASGDNIPLLLKEETKADSLFASADGSGAYLHSPEFSSKS